MKSFVAAMLLAMCIAPLNYAQKTRFGQKTEAPNPADFTLKVHLSASHIRRGCLGYGDQLSCGNQLYAEVVLNGKKLELSGPPVSIEKQGAMIVPGDYAVRLTQDVHNSDGTAIYQAFDLLLPDNTVWHCFTTGISE